MHINTHKYVCVCTNIHNVCDYHVYSISLYIHRYISKKLNIMEKVNIFCHSFEKVKPIYCIDWLHIEWNISSFYFLKCLWLWVTDNENPKFSVQISKWNAKFNFIWKEDFGPLNNSPVLLLRSPGKMFLTMFQVQKWLGSSFPEDVWAWWLLMHWLQIQFTPCEALSSVWIGFAWQYSQACGHPCCLSTFSYPISSFQSTLHLICFDTALLEQLSLSVTMWLTLFVEGVNDRLLDLCQVSSVPHYCAFKEQQISRMYTVWMVIYWNSNVNILIFSDTDFWLSLAVSSNHQT